MPSDLTLNSDYTLETTPSYKTLVSTFENGVEQRRAKRASVIREWRLEYRNRSSADLGTIRTLFNSKYGALTSFTWDNPEDSTTYTVRFKEDSFTYAYKSYGIYDFSFTLVEVL